MLISQNPNIAFKHSCPAISCKRTDAAASMVCAGVLRCYNLESMIACQAGCCGGLLRSHLCLDTCTSASVHSYVAVYTHGMTEKKRCSAHPNVTCSILCHWYKSRFSREMVYMCCNFHKMMLSAPSASKHQIVTNTIMKSMRALSWRLFRRPPQA